MRCCLNYFRQRIAVSSYDSCCPKNNLFAYLQFLKNQPNGFVYNDQQENPKAAAKKNISQPNTPQDPKRQEQLDLIKTTCKGCQACPLATQGRKQVVFGEGNIFAQLMFVGEGPGRDEDEKGRPFIGRAGQLLTKIIQAMELTREDVYISNVVKCRPPSNRVPLAVEIDTCTKLILFKEIEIIKPKIICLLGATSLQALFGNEAKITNMRGKFVEFHGIPTMPTYHPAYLLRNPDAKKIVWEDMKQIMEKIKE